MAVASKVENQVWNGIDNWLKRSFHKGETTDLLPWGPFLPAGVSDSPIRKDGCHVEVHVYFRKKNTYRGHVGPTKMKPIHLKHRVRNLYELDSWLQEQFRVIAENISGGNELDYEKTHAVLHWGDDLPWVLVSLNQYKQWRNDDAATKEAFNLHSLVAHATKKWITKETCRAPISDLNYFFIDRFETVPDVLGRCHSFAASEFLRICQIENNIYANRWEKETNWCSSHVISFLNKPPKTWEAYNKKLVAAQREAVTPAFASLQAFIDGMLPVLWQFGWSVDVTIPLNDEIDTAQVDLQKRSIRLQPIREVATWHFHPNSSVLTTLMPFSVVNENREQKVTIENVSMNLSKYREFRAFPANPSVNSDHTSLGFKLSLMSSVSNANEEFPNILHSLHFLHSEGADWGYNNAGMDWRKLQITMQMASSDGKERQPRGEASRTGLSWNLVPNNALPSVSDVAASVLVARYTSQYTFIFAHVLETINSICHLVNVPVIKTYNLDDSNEEEKSV